MNPAVFEQIVSLLGLIALWAFWYTLWKPQRVDLFRQELFAIRTELFDLAANGTIAFDDPVYAQLRLLINGMIRFAHRASLLTLLIAAIQSKDAPTDSLSVWKGNVQKLPEEERLRLFAVHDRVSEAFGKYLIGGSVTLFSWVILRLLFATLKLVFLLMLGKRKLGNLSVYRAKMKLDRETSQVINKSGANFIEARVLQEEQRRIGLPRHTVFAH